jgi:hypothetical protein
VVFGFVEGNTRSQPYEPMGRKGSMLILWKNSCQKGLPTMGQGVKSNSTPFNYNAIIVRSRVTTYTIIMTCITNCTRINPNATMDIKIMEMQFPRVGEIKDER